LELIVTAEQLIQNAMRPVCGTVLAQLGYRW